MSSTGYGSGPVPPGAGMGPEALNPSRTFDYANYGQRAIAAIIDFLIKVVFAILLAAAVTSAAGVGFMAGDETSGIVTLIVAAAIGFACFAIVSLLYEPAMMAATNGQTVGKKITGCRVIRANGGPMDFGWSLLREVVLKWLAIGMVGNSVTLGLPVATAIDNLWPLWDEEKRALHDLALDTRVVKA